MTISNLIAIYDFEFFPYALGDVLTWNIRTAMHCEETGKSKVDVYICVDEQYPASIYQRGLINPDNFELFFSELYGAFGTNPKLGNLYIFRQRTAMLDQLQEIAVKDEHNLKVFQDYLGILNHKVSKSVLSRIYDTIEKKIRTNHIIKRLYQRLVPTPIKEIAHNTFSHEKVLNNYFIKYIYSHEKINQFAAAKGYIPLLQPSLGCAPDIDEIIGRQFAGKKIVIFHLRLRRLDIGYGGDHTYTRDSDFLEWYHFLREASIKHPDVQFIVLGRLQEKPLEILRLPNVSSLRVYGMGLGHELTLMLKSDLFIGSSSGFAALANFSLIPYFITRMNPGSCHAYAIPEGAEKLPFAKDNQKLIYETETAALLMRLLESGLGLPTENSHTMAKVSSSQSIDVHHWLKLHTNPINSARTTSRFYIDEKYRYEETAYLLLPYLEKARQAFVLHDYQKASSLLSLLQTNFPELCSQLPYYLLLQGSIAIKNKEMHLLKQCIQNLENLPLDTTLEKILAIFKDSLLVEKTMSPEINTLLKNKISQFDFEKVLQ